MGVGALGQTKTLSEGSVRPAPETSRGHSTLRNSDTTVFLPVQWELRTGSRQIQPPQFCARVLSILRSSAS